jgi:hypothetical protein
MKKILIVLAAFVTITSCNEADKTAETNPSSATAAPPEATNTATATTTNTADAPQQNTTDPASITKIEWLDGMDRDFGKMKEGENLGVSFRFKNVGDKPLVISNVSASCGCTAAETPKEPFGPGQTGVIKASFNSSGKPGTQSKQVHVTANTDPATTSLTFHVEVKAKS